MKITLKHDHGEDELDLSKETVQHIALEAAKDNVTFEQKFNQMLQESMDALKEDDEQSDTTKDD